MAPHAPPRDGRLRCQGDRDISTRDPSAIVSSALARLHCLNLPSSLQAQVREVTKVREAEGSALRMENDELTERAARAEQLARDAAVDMENLRMETEYQVADIENEVNSMRKSMEEARGDLELARRRANDALERAEEAELQADHFKAAAEEDQRSLQEQRARSESLEEELATVRASLDEARRERDAAKQQVEEAHRAMEQAAAQAQRQVVPAPTGSPVSAGHALPSAGLAKDHCPDSQTCSGGPTPSGEDKSARSLSADSPRARNCEDARLRFASPLLSASRNQRLFCRLFGTAEHAYRGVAP